MGAPIRLTQRWQVGGEKWCMAHASGGRGCPRGRKLPRFRQSADVVERICAGLMPLEAVSAAGAGIFEGLKISRWSRANSRRAHDFGGRCCPRSRNVPRIRQSADWVGRGQLQRRSNSDNYETGRPARQQRQQRWQRGLRQQWRRRYRLHLRRRRWRKSTVTRQQTGTTVRLG